MTTPESIIQLIRDSSTSNREVGEKFEKFSIKFLLTDPVWKGQFSRVLPFSDWATENGWTATDIGIDLVGELADGSGCAAVQCKCYEQDRRIQKGDLEALFSAANKDPFELMIFIDSTEGEWGKNAEIAIGGRTNFKRISLDDLRKSKIDWNDFASKFISKNPVNLQPMKETRPHQSDAIARVLEGFGKFDRGKLIMACGTGKTYTSLKIAENIGGGGGRILLLVPSLALMSQTIREWYSDTSIEIRGVAVCSDSQVTRSIRKGSSSADTIDANTDIDASDLAIPVTTDFDKLIVKLTDNDLERMTVVFSTYQSIEAISKAQAAGMPEFDLIICDEAHRTTGVSISGEDDSSFIKVHDNDCILGKKRLYMTATPRIYSDKAKRKADDMNAVLCSMDNVSLFGPEFYRLNFGKAVDMELLSDYKVVVLAMDQNIVSRSVQNRFKENNELKLDNATKIIGCYKALLKHGDKFLKDNAPMRRAIMFCDSIKASKLICSEFKNVVNEFSKSEFVEEDYFDALLDCKINHVDGTFNSKQRDNLLNWLGKDSKCDTECRILSNAKCLSEGVDVPDLDAIMFMHPRKSQVDIVQAVGRVMRTAKDKDMGYIILPVVIPPNVSPDVALDDHKNYGVIWSVLNALRSHDDRFDAIINKFDINGDFGDRILVIGETAGRGIEGNEIIRDPDQLDFLDKFTTAVKARIVKKCGTKMYWQDWANNIGEIAGNYTDRIKGVLESDCQSRKVFDKFLIDIRADINEEITEGEAIEMLGQQFVTKPVFDALFEGYEFVNMNSVSKSMQEIVRILEPTNIQSESDTLQSFYNGVKAVVSGINSLEGRQKVILTLYEKFFSKAFKKLVQKLGIVYTPVEVVDFIIHSINHILEKEFGKNLGNKGVHIIDPFTGTGTFITRLLQSGLISPEEMEHKFKNEIHANEIVLLAYYIAAINIETVYQNITGKKFIPFEGICLTDTFAMTNKDDLLSEFMEDNNNRRARQSKLDIRVILGNPPYSARQKSQNDDAKNLSYPEIDDGISRDYAEVSTSGLKQYLYDNYIRAIYWANSRLGKDGGVVGFITGNGWLTKGFSDGMRKHLERECSNIYIINLRGDIRDKRMNKFSKEGENVFGQGSQNGISIAFFVKNPASKNSGQIHYFEVGDDLTTQDKLEWLRKTESIENLLKSRNFETISADENGDWLNKRDDSFNKFISMGDKDEKEGKHIFETYTLGVSTNRIAWCINSSKTDLEQNVKRMIDFYHHELNRFEEFDKKGESKNFVVDNDQTKIKWSDNLKKSLYNKNRIDFNNGDMRIVHVKPFNKKWLYYSRQLNERVSQTPQLFPNTDTRNRNIVVSGKNARTGFCVLMNDTISDLSYIEAEQCFPLKLPKSNSNLENSNKDIFMHNGVNEHVVEKDGITDFGLQHFQKYYGCNEISKENLFYYIYGLLHSEDYRVRFANNIQKKLPRIPPVKNLDCFWEFVYSGEKLGNLHVQYEEAELYPVRFKKGKLEPDNEIDLNSYFRVKKMKSGIQGTEISYNENISIDGIPKEAYDYVVNGESAIKWVINSQSFSVHNKSGITNDPNIFAIETMGDPAYPLKLLLKIITTSVKTLEIVKSLPNLEIQELT